MTASLKQALSAIEAKKAKLADTLSAASRQARKFAQDTREKEARLEGLRADFEACRTAEALGLPSVVEQPDSAEMEKLRLETEFAPKIQRTLDAKRDQHEAELAVVEIERKSAIGAGIEQSYLNPALEELEGAFDTLHAAAVKVMAAHFLAKRRFAHNPPNVSHANELYGPVGEWLTQLRSLQWPAYPYEICPSWLPRYGAFWVDEMQGFSEQIALIEDAIEQEAL